MTQRRPHSATHNSSPESSAFADAPNTSGVDTCPWRIVISPVTSSPERRQGRMFIHVTRPISYVTHFERALSFGEAQAPLARASAFFIGETPGRTPHRPPGPEKGGRTNLSAASGIAYGTSRPFTLPLNWTEVGRNANFRASWVLSEIQ